MLDKTKDLLLGLGLLMVGVIALIAIRTSEGGTRIASAAKLTYSTMPTIYAWILILLVSLFIVKTTLAISSEQSMKRRDKDNALKEERAPETVVSRTTILLRTWGTLSILLCYVLLLEYVHFLILTTLFLAILFFVYGQRSIKKIAAVSVCGGAAFYFLFIYILNLPV